MSDIIYNWRATQNLSDWKLEGLGEMRVEDDGSLHIRTFNCGIGRRATNAWLFKLDLPENFEVEWSYQSSADTGETILNEGAMLVFNACPVALKHLFEDPRPHARYSDLYSYRKLVAYTCGFFRTPYGEADQLRKLGGNVPPTWGETNLTSEDGRNFQQLTIMAAGSEPDVPVDRRHARRYRLRHAGPRIEFWCQDQLVFDWTDTGQYRYWPEPLVGGKMAFRQFNGYIDCRYDQILVRRL